jgi:basic membrane protein A
MKKVLKIVLAIVLLAGLATGFTSCNRDDNNAGNAGNNAASSSDLVVYLISHSPPPDSTLDDGSFNQGSADGIRRFARTHGTSFTADNFMQPHSPNDEARLDIFADAIRAGADVLVLPGWHFANSAYTAQTLFPDTKFIVIDSGPAGPPAANLIGIIYAEQESGFLAGYAAVREGFTKLGFMGGNPVPAVIRFGLGFLMGAEHAAKAMGLNPGDIEVNFHYLGGFGASPEITATANVWYAAGTEVIFVAAGAAGNSVVTAAEASGAWMIGVDVDQSGLSPRVITSAMKALENSIYDMLVDINNNTFRGGQVLTYTAATNGVALPMNNSRFSTFTQAQYDAIFAQLANGSVVVPGLVTNPVDPPAELAHVVAQLTLVQVNDI